MKVWQAIGVTIIIVLGFVLMLMWVNAIELEQEREETWQRLERRQQHQADELYRIEEKRKWDEKFRHTREQEQRYYDELWKGRGR